MLLFGLGFEFGVGVNNTHVIFNIPENDSLKKNAGPGDVSSLAFIHVFTVAELHS